MTFQRGYRWTSRHQHTVEQWSQQSNGNIVLIYFTGSVTPISRSGGRCDAHLSSHYVVVIKRNRRCWRTVGVRTNAVFEAKNIIFRPLVHLHTLTFLPLAARHRIWIDFWRIAITFFNVTPRRVIRIVAVFLGCDNFGLVTFII